MLRIARREPSAILLAAQLAAVLLYPFRSWRRSTSTGLSDVIPIKP